MWVNIHFFCQLIIPSPLFWLKNCSFLSGAHSMWFRWGLIHQRAGLDVWGMNGYVTQINTNRSHSFPEYGEEEALSLGSWLQRMIKTWNLLSYRSSRTFLGWKVLSFISQKIGNYWLKIRGSDFDRKSPWLQDLPSSLWGDVAIRCKRKG